MPKRWQWAKGDGEFKGFDYPSSFCNPALDLSGNLYMACAYYASYFYL